MTTEQETTLAIQKFQAALLDRSLTELVLALKNLYSLQDVTGPGLAVSYRWRKNARPGPKIARDLRVYPWEKDFEKCARALLIGMAKEKIECPKCGVKSATMAGWGEGRVLLSCGCSDDLDDYFEGRF